MFEVRAWNLGEEPEIKCVTDSEQEAIRVHDKIWSEDAYRFVMIADENGPWEWWCYPTDFKNTRPAREE